MVAHEGNRRVLLASFPAIVRFVSQRLFSAAMLGALIRDDADFVTDPPPSLIREVRVGVEIDVCGVVQCAARRGACVLVSKLVNTLVWFGLVWFGLVWFGLWRHSCLVSCAGRGSHRSEWASARVAVAA